MPRRQTSSTLPLSLTWSSLFYSAASAQASITRIARAEAEIPGNYNPNTLDDKAYLPAQIGGIVGAYAVSLVLVAIILLSLSKKRREHLNAGNDEIDFEDTKLPVHFQFALEPEPIVEAEPQFVPNFSYPSPTKTEFSNPGAYVHHSPTSSIGAPGINPFVDQKVVAADKVMAQNQLEDMYKYVMEHEEAKQKGIVLEAPIIPRGSQYSGRSQQSQQAQVSQVERPATLTKKERSKPASLNLSMSKEDKSQQPRTSSFFSALRSPRKKNVKGVSISSPIMTPKSATFPRHEENQELATMPPRHYNPLPPPPVPTERGTLGISRIRTHGAPMTPDISPDSIQSIDERIGGQLGHGGYGRAVAHGELDPESATSEHSQVPLMGLPSSPRLGGRFPSLPGSPKPGATFSRPNAPSAIRTGGALPLRAYEPAMTSPSATSYSTTKQTVFERKGPLSPGLGTARTPGTAVPYSPYQPFTPCMPITPSLITREDRKRMKRMVPKTPTLQMVERTDDVW